jgi:hypothetical protein
MNFEAGFSCSPSHRQAIQQEGPILVDDVKQSSSRLGRIGGHSLTFPETRPDSAISLPTRLGLIKNISIYQCYIRKSIPHAMNDWARPPEF